MQCTQKGTLSAKENNGRIDDPVTRTSPRGVSHFIVYLLNSNVFHGFNTVFADYLIFFIHIVFTNDSFIDMCIEMFVDIVTFAPQIILYRLLIHSLSNKIIIFNLFQN